MRTITNLDNFEYSDQIRFNFSVYYILDIYDTKVNHDK